MKRWEPDLVIGMLMHSAEIALKHYEAPEKEIKIDKSIVTIADKAIENYLAGYFDSPQSGSYLIGEETVNSKSAEYIRNAFKNIAWIIDPIDGTAPYSHHIPLWGISIGYSRNGIIEEGAVFHPCTGELFITDGDAVYYKSCGPDMLKWDFRMGAMTRLSLPVKCVNEYELICLTQRYAKYRKLKIVNPINVLCCATYSFTYTVLGRYLGYIGLNLCLWDYAAAFAMLKKLGFIVEHFDGRKLSDYILDNHDIESPDRKKWAIQRELIIASSKEIAGYIVRNTME